MTDYKKVILDVKNSSKESRIQAAFHLENIADDESVKALGKALG